MLKDHKTHFPQRTKTLQQSSRLALVQSLHSEFMQLWVFGIFASNKFLCQMLFEFVVRWFPDIKKDIKTKVYHFTRFVFIHFVLTFSTIILRDLIDPKD